MVDVGSIDEGEHHFPFVDEKDMSQATIVVQGTVNADGTLELAEKLNCRPVGCRWSFNGCRI